MSTTDPERVGADIDALVRDSIDSREQRSATRVLLLSAGAAVALIAALVAALAVLHWSGAGPAELYLSPVLIIATVTLVMLLASLTLVFRRLELSDRNLALGLPEGSIRAVIALMLILLFFIMAIFLFGQVKQSSAQPRVLQGLSATAADAIPADQILARVPVSSNGQEAVYTVTLRSTVDPAVKDISGQLITTISTLVVAVSSFYFGTSAAGQARRRADADTDVSSDTTKPRPSARP